MPLEREPLQDTAVSFGGKSRTPGGGVGFFPVGHISLDSQPSNQEPELTSSYAISTFYVSAQLQGSGIGGSAMSIVEKLASNPPLNAKTLLLRTWANENYANVEQFSALKTNPPRMSTQDWYTSMGYVRYGYVEKCWDRVDEEGRVWWNAAALMKKDVV
jgi:hypothetical protein